MASLKFLTDGDPRNGDWAVRGAVALFFLVFGAAKFSWDPDSHWVTLFSEIGAGSWFRYFAGVVETLGAVLVALPRTALAGLAMLACAMFGAVLILIIVLGRPAEAIFPGICLAGLAAVAWNRWRWVGWIR